MPKHSLPTSPFEYTSTKRVVLQNQSQMPTSFDNALYDELILLIFSYLSYTDLCNIQRTNRHWSRLTLDNQLWRNLYLKEFGRSRLRGSKGLSMTSIIRLDGRQTRPLPGRARGQGEAQHANDWKWMFRISCNWRTGRSSPKEEEIWPDSEDSDLPVHVVLAGGLVLTASPVPSSSPRVLLHISGRVVHSFASSSMPSNSGDKITTMALDQSRPSSSDHRLMVFYSSGSFCLFLISIPHPGETREVLMYAPIGGRRRAPVVQAVYHHPLLITLSSSFDLNVYQIPSLESESHHQIRLTQTLTSFTSYPPASLILTNPTPDIYKLVLAYSVPVYPSHWTVAVTELCISSFTVQSTQSASASELTPGWSALTTELMETLKELNVRKLAQVSSVSTDGRFVALASATTTSIQLYRLVSRSRAAGYRLTFVRTLHGHISTVQALSVADGRCVSLGRDGSLWVWDLDGNGVEVKTEALCGLPTSARLVFDERQILVVLNGRIIVKRFDV